MGFAGGTDVYRARQLVEERLTQAHALPNVSKPPTLLQPLSSSNRVLMVGVSSDEASPIEQSVIARWTVRPRLMGVPGVANVSIWGLRDQQLQVQVDPERLRAAGVTLAQVVESAGNAQVVSPLSFLEASTPGTGGFIETPQQRLQVRHLLERIADPAELGKVPVTGTGGEITLADVSTIVVDHQPLIGDAVVDGNPGLLLVVEKFPGASTRTVTEGVEDALEDLRPGLAGIRTDTSLFRPARYLDEAEHNLAVAGAAAFLLLLLGLALLRLDWRGLVVVLVTVPLSLVAAGLMLRAFGQGFNVLTIAGLGAAIAVLVDEAVVAGDRIVHRLRRGSQESGPMPTAVLVRRAAQDVRTPLGFATAAVLLVALPVLVMGGRPGSFFATLAWAYVAAVAAATLVAVVVAPVLVMLLFGVGRPGQGRPPLPRRVREGYPALLERFGSRVARPVALAAVLLVVGTGALAVLTPALVPRLQDRSVLVRLDGQPGTSNPEMTQTATRLSNRLRDLPGVSSVAATIGRAVTGDRVVDVNSSDVWVRIANDADYGDTVAAVRAVADEVGDVPHRVLTYSAQEVRDVGGLREGSNPARGAGLALLTGSDEPLVVRVFGQDPTVLREQAQRVRAMLRGVDGVVHPRVDLPATEPTIEIEVDLDRARGFGMTPGAVRRAGATLLQGIQVGSVFQQQKVFDVIVQGAPSTRESVADVRNLLIDRPGGGHVRLGEVADVRVVDDIAVIERDAVSRRIDVTAGVQGRGVDVVTDEVRSRLAGLDLPLEYHAEVVEQGTGHEIGAGRVAAFALAVVVAAFLLVQAVLRSWSWAAVVSVCLPLALVGGLLTGPLAGPGLSLGALVGHVAVLCLAVRTTVLLAARAQASADTGVAPATAARAAARERLAPVVMTTTGLAAAALPFVLLGGRPGLEILHPMAVVLLGGLVTTALVTLLLVPSLLAHVPLRPGSGSEPGDGDGDQRRVDLVPIVLPGDLVGEPVPAQRGGVRVEDASPATGATP
jgi:Cu/Ag efflux pump CusA